MPGCLNPYVKMFNPLTITLKSSDFQILLSTQMICNICCLLLMQKHTKNMKSSLFQVLRTEKCLLAQVLLIYLD